MVGTYLGERGVLAGAGDAARGDESELARPPALWAGRLSAPAPSAARCCPGAVAAALAAVAGEGAGVCARPEPLQHLCIKMCSSLSLAPLTGWLLSSANARALEMTSSAPSPPFPSPPSWLYLICCHLRTGASQSARVFHMHGRLSSRALSGLPPPHPPPLPRSHPAQS